MVGPARGANVRRLWALLALVALAVQILVPPGYMAAAGPAGPALTICIGHGPLTLPAGSDRRAPARPRHGAPSPACAFAGHGVALSAPPPAPIATAFVLRAPAACSELLDGSDTRHQARD